MSLTRSRKAKPVDEVKDGRGRDLFDWLHALYNKKQLEGTPPVFMLYRFLASDRNIAGVCALFAKEIRDPRMEYHILQRWLPKGKEAPRFDYVAPKKPPAEEALVAKIEAHKRVRRAVAEEMVAIVKLMGPAETAALYHEYRLEVPA